MLDVGECQIAFNQFLFFNDIAALGRLILLCPFFNFYNNFKSNNMSEQKKSVENENAEMLQNGSTAVAIFDPVKGALPDLSNDMEVSPISDVSEYWTPESIGESKKVFFDCMSSELLIDEETGEERVLPAVIMWEQKEGKLFKISNSSSRLVGHFQRSNYNQGQPLLITYKGKQKNKNNQYQSDTWDVNKLFPKK